MSVAETFLNAENMRTLLLLIAMFSGFIWLKYSFHIDIEQKFKERDKLIDKRFEAIDKRFEAVDKRFEDLDRKFELKFEAMDRKMDEKFDRFYQMIKANDFAHLSKTIVALTYTLQKNDFLKREDKEYIDGMLES